ncbi:protein valois [Drosophila subpulchrella]|uniref:protein valois n=1 Tax=Drosophila subpulchrella TaxID=1486046 RepID=UPI0018A15319|nr:protein valois [Drosophila subpulchrella]
MFPQRSSELYRTPDTHQPPPALELAGNLEYPNLNVADLNARLENLSPRLHDCWDSIAINEQQHFALATNRREGGHWWGMFFGYGHSQLNHMTVDSADFKLQAEHTVNIVRYAENDVLLVALGDTRLQAWSTYSKVRNPQSPYCLFLVGESHAHSTPISQLSVFKADRQRAVSGSADGTLNVWDLSGIDLVSSYHSRTAHTDKMTALATPSASADKFVTCDRGGCARIWDVRAAAPSSTCLYADSTHVLSFTSAAWAAATELQGDNYVYIGDYDGQVHTLDIRVPRKLAETREYFDKGHVSQLLINGPYLAAMSNLPASVKVANAQANYEFIYTHQDTHTRLTDAVWSDDSTLITIGHGRKMVTHSLK